MKINKIENTPVLLTKQQVCKQNVSIKSSINFGVRKPEQPLGLLRKLFRWFEEAQIEMNKAGSNPSANIGFTPEGADLVLSLQQGLIKNR